jgi:histidinol phosphatase-like enzyme (inositol monophosphatase family)
MSINTQVCGDRLRVAIEASREAGRIAMQYFGQSSLDVKFKADATPVTLADQHAEQALRSLIHRHFPEDTVQGEEFGLSQGTSEFTWILDPIDGTKSFIHGVPLFGVLVAIKDRNDFFAGVIHMPGLDQTVYAGKTLGAWLLRGSESPERISVSKPESLKKSLLATSSFDYFIPKNREMLFVNLCTNASASRGWADCYAFFLLAQGLVDLVVEPELQVWDWAAMKPIVEEAGGVITDWKGDSPCEVSTIVACPRSIHQDVVALTRSFT